MLCTVTLMLCPAKSDCTSLLRNVRINGMLNNAPKYLLLIGLRVLVGIPTAGTVRRGYGGGRITRTPGGAGRETPLFSVGTTRHNARNLSIA